MSSIAEKTRDSLTHVRILNGSDGEDLILLHAYFGQFENWHQTFQNLQAPDEKQRFVLDCLDALVGSPGLRAQWEVLKGRFAAYASRNARVADAVGALFDNLVPLKSYALKYCASELEKRGLLGYLRR